MNFHLIDWIIVFGYLAATMAAGLYGKRYVTGLGDFLVAGRKLGTYIGIATLAATEIGTITFMYNAQLGFRTGYSSFIIGLISGLVMIFIGRTGFLVKKMRALGIMTVPEFFEVRYSRKLRLLTGVLVAIGGILNMGVFLKVEGTFLLLISGLSRDYLKEMMTGILILEVLYTVLGGMVSIVITDFIQFVFLGIGTVLITVFTIHKAGWDHMYHTVLANQGAAGFNPLIHSDFGWSYIIFQILLWMAVDTCWQTTAMRTFSTKDPETSKKVFSWTGFIFLGRGMMPMLWGIGALALLGPCHFAADSPQFQTCSLEAMPLMLAKILPVGILGLVTAGMLAATMSVNSSYLLGWSSVIAQDVVGPARKTPLSTKGQLRLNRVTNLCVSLFVWFWGIWYTLPGPVYYYLNITATIFLAGAFAAVTGGLYWSRSNTVGGYSAMLAGAAGSIAFFFFKWSPAYAGLGSFAFAAIAMVIGSLIGGRTVKSAA